MAESENFSLGVLHFDPKYHTFNIVSIICLVRSSYRLKEFLKKGLKRFKGFEGLEPFKVCTLRERISHVLSKNCHVLGKQTLFSEAERANCFVCAHFMALQFSKVEF